MSQTVLFAAWAGLVGFVLVILWQLRQIHRAVNSNMTKALDKIDSLYREIVALNNAAQRRL